MFRRPTAIALLALAASLVGCGGVLSKPYPEKVRYAIEAPMPADGSAGTLPPLRIGTIRAYQPYDGLSLVYRTGSSTYTADYYNTFVAAPDRLLTGEVEDYLSRAGLFSVVSTGPRANTRYVLEGDLMQLYGDFRKDSAPAAVIALRFFLIDDEDAAAKVLVQKTYRHTQPIRDRTADALVEGWNQGLGVILQQLTHDIEAGARTVEMPRAAGSLN